jgi:hypothetical protein
MSQPIVHAPTHLLFKIICCVYMYSHISTLTAQTRIMATQIPPQPPPSSQIPSLPPLSSQKSSTEDLR